MLENQKLTLYHFYASWTRDSRFIVSSSDDGELICWDPESTEIVGRAVVDGGNASVNVHPSHRCFLF
jgi:hypothetical protein